MRLIAWDTSSKVGSVAALDWDVEGHKTMPRIVAEWTLNLDSGLHSERLLWAVDQVLKVSGWDLESVDYFGVGVGPGSFTGLRIGMTTARTLAFVLGKPIIPVSSLAALARPVALLLQSVRPPVLVIVAQDAAKKEFFSLWGAAKSVKDCVYIDEGGIGERSIWKRGVEEQLLSPDDLIAQIKKKLKWMGPGALWTYGGDAFKNYSQLWKSLPEDSFLDCGAGFFQWTQARYIGLLAWESVQQGVVRSPEEVFPRYMRDSDAEIKLRQGLLKKSPLSS